MSDLIILSLTLTWANLGSSWDSRNYSSQIIISTPSSRFQNWSAFLNSILWVSKIMMCPTLSFAGLSLFIGSLMSWKSMDKLWQIKIDLKLDSSSNTLTKFSPLQISSHQNQFQKDLTSLKKRGTKKLKIKGCKLKRTQKLLKTSIMG